MKISLKNTVSDKKNMVCILESANEFPDFLSTEIVDYVKSKKKDNGLVHYKNGASNIIFVIKDKNKGHFESKEALRNYGAEIFEISSKEELAEIDIFSGKKGDSKDVSEGIALSAYSFHKYKTAPKENTLKEIALISGDISQEELAELQNLTDAVYIARTLVNEPVSYLTAEELSENISKLGKEAGFNVEVLNKAKIQSLKMGGLLGVNQGSIDPPTFNILEYQPENAINQKPIVLVGKGVVYDTGGLSLKPSDSMDTMKCDMAGAAAVAGLFYALAKNKLPLYVVGLIPATDNRPDGNALAPGDILTTFSGKTVEVLNTDAEGRLILADALTYAKKYDPELVIDLATLTGAAARAIGKEGVVYMGNADIKTKKELEEAGYETYERLVEFPLWEEYGKQIHSDIADIKNLGGPEAGAITAGKFLEHFVDYQWIHIDIAGMAFLSSKDSYRGKNGTGIGVRLLYQFLKKKLIK